MLSKKVYFPRWDKSIIISPHAGSNHGPFAYEASALPLSYRGTFLSQSSDNLVIKIQKLDIRRRRYNDLQVFRKTYIHTYYVVNVNGINILEYLFSVLTHEWHKHEHQNS